MAVAGVLLFPLKREVTLKKPIKHFIKGDFDSLILYPIDKNSGSINISKDDYWTCDDSGDA